MTSRVALGILCACALVTDQPPRGWLEFQADTLGISFHHPPTSALRFETRAATCTHADRNWQGGAPDSIVVVTRSVVRIEQIAAHLAIVRSGGKWIAEGYQGHQAPVASVRVGGWEALVADQAVTVIYDMEVRSPVKAKQWRLVAMGPASDGCRPLIFAMATGIAEVWDSTIVAKVLESASPQH